MFGAKFYFLAKEQGYRHPIDNLKYSKDLVSKLECEDNLVNKAFSTSPLTNCGSEGCFENRNRATTL